MQIHTWYEFVIRPAHRVSLALLGLGRAGGDAIADHGSLPRVIIMFFFLLLCFVIRLCCPVCLVISVF